MNKSSSREATVIGDSSMGTDGKGALVAPSKYAIALHHLGSWLAALFGSLA